MKPFGNKLLFLFVLLSGCKSYKFVGGGQEVKQTYSYYCNDSLKLNLQFFGDFGQFNTKVLPKEDSRFLKKIVKSNANQILFSSKTTLEPFYNTIVCLRDSNSINLNKYSIKKQGNLAFWYQENKSAKPYYEIIMPFRDKYLSFFYSMLKNDKMAVNDFDEMAFWNLERILKNEPCVELPNPFNLANNSFNESPSKNYLAAVTLQKQENNYQNKQDKSNYYQALATYYSFAHQIKESKETWKRLDNLYGENTKKDSTGLMPISKKQVIDLIKNEQVVMFNEAHHHPEHRYFLGTLLDTLYHQAGFRYLALESITHADSLNASSPKIPTFNDGFYIREPIYANMVKQALHLGYTLVEYEAWEGDRETAQAQNLYNQTLKKDPKAKIIVLAGYSHIEEKPIDGKPWMASIFKSISGVNPYTINQTEAMFRKNINNQTQEFYSLQIDSTSNDLIIYNNINLSKTNHCFSSSESKTIQITIDADSLAENQNYALLIYKKEELEKTNQAIPVFVKILEKGQNQALATLCVGKYIAFCKNHYGDNTWNKNIIVEK